MLETKHEADLRQTNPLTLAFLGDGVYELLAREEIVRRYTSLSAGRLHERAVELVRASSQAEAYKRIVPELDEQEREIYRRGRNASGVTVPKSASPAEYRSATGLETLFGWLYLTGKTERIHQLFSRILSGEAEHEATLQHSVKRGTELS